LLDALFDTIRAFDPGIGSMESALELPAREAFTEFFGSWIQRALRFEPKLRMYWRDIESDPEMLKVVRQADERFLGLYKQLFDKIEAAGLLRPIWTAEEAAASAYQTTMYGIFLGHLNNMRGWPPQQIIAQGLKVLKATFLIDEAAGWGRG
jgi:hypothetical protein